MIKQLITFDIISIKFKNYFFKAFCFKLSDIRKSDKGKIFLDRKCYMIKLIIIW